MSQIPDWPEDRPPTPEEVVEHGRAQDAWDADILERLRKHYQTKIDNVNQDEMVEGPFDDGTEDGELWEQAASRIDARGGLRVHFTFADQEGSSE